MSEITAETVVAALRRKFFGREYATFEQLRNSTGFNTRTETIDFAAFNLWPSGGLTRAAFEVKVSRQDFLRELQTPSKNATFRSMFHEFWYATAPKVVADIREIPDGCGWLELHGERFHTKLKAPRNKSAQIDDLLVSAICRACNREVTDSNNDAIRKYLETDSQIKRWKTIAAAVDKFAKLRGRYIDTHKDEAKILEDLLSCVSEKHQEQELAILNEMQDRLLKAWQALTILTGVSVKEIDDAGNKILRRYYEDAAFDLALSRLKSKHEDKPNIKAELLSIAGIKP